MKKKTHQKSQGRPPKIFNLLPQLKKLGVFRIQDAKRLGISQPTLSRLVATNKILHLDTGLYAHPGAAIKPEEQDYIVACKKFGPAAVVGGLTALFHYGLIEQIPKKIWVIVPYHIKATSLKYRMIRTKTDHKIGIKDFGNFRITSLERTLVEAFRYASKIGLRVALHATRTALAEKKTTLKKVYEVAKMLELSQYIERHWEAIVPEGQA